MFDITSCIQSIAVVFFFLLNYKNNYFLIQKHEYKDKLNLLSCDFKLLILNFKDLNRHLKNPKS